ncbi:MAG: zinc-binding dehydrogenase, partial [Mycobacterium sp.]
RALELGADHALDSRDPDVKAHIERITGGMRLDVAFDAVGLKTTFEQALDCLTVGGRLVAVGMSAESPTVGPTSMFGLTQKQVLGHLGYQNVDIETLATVVSLGRLDLSRSISRVIGLEETRDGIEMLEHADGNPIRILVQP